MQKGDTSQLCGFGIPTHRKKPNNYYEQIFLFKVYQERRMGSIGDLVQQSRSISIDHFGRFIGEYIYFFILFGGLDFGAGLQDGQEECQSGGARVQRNQYAD